MAKQFPVSLDPRMLDPLRDRDLTRPVGIHFLEDPDLDTAAAAIRIAREAAETAQRSTEATLASRMEASARNAKLASDTNDKLRDRALGRLDSAFKTLSGVADALRKKVAPGSSTNVAEEMQRSEIRTYLRSISPAERSKIIGKGEELTISAIVHAEPYLSGLSKPEIDFAVANWQRRQFPAEVARIEKLDKVLATIEQSANLTMSFISSLTDQQAIAEAAASEKRARDARAAAEAA